MSTAHSENFQEGGQGRHLGGAWLPQLTYLASNEQAYSFEDSGFGT